MTSEERAELEHLRRYRVWVIESLDVLAKTSPAAAAIVHLEMAKRIAGSSR